MEAVINRDWKVSEFETGVAINKKNNINVYNEVSFNTFDSWIIEATKSHSVADAIGSRECWHYFKITVNIKFSGCKDFEISKKIQNILNYLHQSDKKNRDNIQHCHGSTFKCWDFSQDIDFVNQITKKIINNFI